MRALQITIFAVCTLIARPVIAAFALPVETFVTFTLTVGLAALIFFTVIVLIAFWHQSKRSLQVDHSEPEPAAPLGSTGIQNDKGNRGWQEVLKILTISSTEAAKTAASAATHAALAARRSAAAAQEAADKSLEASAEAAAEATMEAAEAARQSMTVAEAAAKTAQDAMEYQADDSLRQAATQAAAAARQASKSAAEAVRMAHAASATLKPESASLLRRSV